MRFRWSIKELKENSDNEMIRDLLVERMSDLHPYSPLRERLQMLYDKYDKKVKNEKSD